MQDNTIQKDKDKHPCRKRDSNPLSQRSRPTTQTERSLGPAPRCFKQKILKMDIKVLFKNASYFHFLVYILVSTNEKPQIVLTAGDAR